MQVRAPSLMPVPLSLQPRTLRVAQPVGGAEQPKLTTADDKRVDTDLDGFRAALLSDFKAILKDENTSLMKAYEKLFKDIIYDVVHCKMPPTKDGSGASESSFDAHLTHNDITNGYAAANGKTSSRLGLFPHAGRQCLREKEKTSSPAKSPEKEACCDSLAISGSDKGLQSSDSLSMKARSRWSAHMPGEVQGNRQRSTRREKPKPANSAGAATGVVLFGDMEWIQDSQALDEPEYDVISFYSETGFCQAVARTSFFSSLTVGFVCLNAVYLGLETDRSLGDNETVYDVINNMFCVFFLMELALRFGAFAQKLDCLKDFWFKFDLFLIVLMVVETWVLTLVAAMGSSSIDFAASGNLRVIRLLRLVRLTRLMRALPELMTMIKGMLSACRAVASTLLMLIILDYVFAIVMKSDAIREWSTIPHCMLTLALKGIFLDDLGGAVTSLVDGGEYLSLVMFMIFVLVSAMTIMNMLVGVLCEVVSKVAEAEKETAARSQVRASILEMLVAIDKDGNGMITKKELLSVFDTPDALQLLQDLDVDLSHLLQLHEMLYSRQGSVMTITQILEIILEHRGDRAPTMRDLVNGSAFNRWQMQSELQKLSSKLMAEMEDMLAPNLQQVFSRPDKCSV